MLFLLGFCVGVLFPIFFPEKFNLVKKKVINTIKEAKTEDVK